MINYGSAMRQADSARWACFHTTTTPGAFLFSYLNSHYLALNIATGPSGRLMQLLPVIGDLAFRIGHHSLVN
jgi:hypothetical protein